MANNSKTTITLSIDESPDRLAIPKYARPAANTTRVSRRQAAWLGALVLAVLIPAFISLGLWQWHKAEAKTSLQAELDARSHDAAVVMPGTPVDGESLRYRRVILRGHFDAGHQILLDNQLSQEQAGYHVITPLRIEGSDLHVLVDRGWLPAPADHRLQPPAEVPAEPVELSGIAVLPPSRFFNLAAQPSSGWSPVWQNLDLQRFRQSVPYPLQPVIVQLDANSPHGFTRQWPRPDERADRHLSYALQWFGFAIASIGIWLYFLVRRQ